MNPRITAILEDRMQTAKSLRLQRRFSEAEEIVEMACSLYSQLFGTDSPEYAEARYNQGLLHHDQGKDDKAQSYFKRAIEALERRAHKLAADPGTAGEAPAVYRKAISLAKACLGANAPRKLIVLLNGLSICLPEKRQRLETQELALSLGEEHLSHGDSMLWKLAANLGRTCQSLRLHQKAAEAFLRALEHLEARHPIDVQGMMRCLVDLTKTYVSMSDLSHAEVAYQDLINLLQEHVPGDPYMLTHVNYMAWLYLRQAKWSDAEAILKDGLRRYGSRIGSTEEEQKKAQTQLSEALHAQGKDVTICGTGELPWREFLKGSAACAIQFAHQLKEQGNYRQAASALQNVLKEVEKQLRSRADFTLVESSLSNLLGESVKVDTRPRDPLVAELSYELSLVYSEAGEPAKAEDSLKQALACVGESSLSSPLSIRYLHAYAALLRSVDRSAEAQYMESCAEAIRKSTF